MAKRPKTWYGAAGVDLIGQGTATGLVSNIALVSVPEGLNQVHLSLKRILLSLNVYVSGLIVGDTNVHLWAGLALSELDALGAGQRLHPIPSIQDWNDEVWLWRQAIPLFTNSYSDILNSLMTSHWLDWPVRRGKGSTARESQAFVLCFEINPSVASGPTIQIDYEALQLFGQSV